MFSEFRDQLSAIIEALEGGAHVDEDSVGRLMSRIQASVPDMSRAEVIELHEAVGRAIALVVAQKENVASELQQIRKGKKALRGYSHIRGHRTSQRLCRQA